MSVFNIILLVMMYPLLPIVYFQFKNEAKPKKNIILGVTLPYGELLSQGVADICGAYRKRLKTALWVCLPLPLASLLTGYASISMSILMAWLLLVLLWGYALYVGANRRMRAYKLGLSLPMEEAGGGVVVDLSAVARGGIQVKPGWYILPVALSLLPLVHLLLFSGAHGEGFWWTFAGCLTMFLTVLLFPLVDRALRWRSDAASGDSRLNAALTQMRRGYWRRCSVQCSCLTALFCLLFYAMLMGYVGSLWGLVGMIAYSLLILAAALYAEFGCRRAQERMAGALEAPLDTDANWPLGMFYYNKADKRHLVHARVGVGSTFNMAHFWGKCIMGLSALCILAIPALCGWMVAEEFTPIQARLTGDSLTVTHLSVCYRADLADIENVELLEELPGATKIVGTGMSTVLKGSFNVNGYGAAKLYLNPQKAPFITFTDGEERVFLNAAGLEALLGVEMQLS